MLLPLNEIEGLLRCPRSGTPLVRDGEAYASVDGGHRYALRDGFPVLVDFDASVLSPDDVRTSSATSLVVRDRYAGVGRLAKRLVAPPKRSTARNVEAIGELLAERDSPRVLVVGGGLIGAGMAPFYASPDIGIVAFDIYGSDCTQLVADGHAIPLADESFDLVVVQAVLEHVLSPRRVVDECHRVLKRDGLVYAETPFMQQVHEGPYDFTRFSDSGHRYLFRRFEVLRSGASGGPGLALMGAIDYFARSLFRSRGAGKAAKLAFFWLAYLDALIPEPYAIDAANGVFLLGRKAAAEIAPADVIAYYQGAE